MTVALGEDLAERLRRKLLALEIETPGGKRKGLPALRGKLVMKELGLSTGRKGTYLAKHRQRLAEIATFYLFEARYGGLPDSDTLMEVEQELGPSDTQLRRAYRAGRNRVLRIIQALDEVGEVEPADLAAAAQALDAPAAPDHGLLVPGGVEVRVFEGPPFPNPRDGHEHLTAAIEPAEEPRRRVILALVRSMANSKREGGIKTRKRKATRP